MRSLAVLWPVLLVAALMLAGLLAVSAQYGFHGDEMYYVVAGQHPAFGYVDQPPLTPLLSAASVALLGVTPTAVRVLPALEMALIVVLIALMARDLGGSRRAQVLAAITAALSGYLGAGHLDTTTDPDLLAWAIILWLLAKLLAGGDRRLWLVVGVVAGIGLENGMADTALASVAERLATPHGIVLNNPAFTYYHLELGEISTYPEGYKENAGIFCHTNPWVMIAATRVRNGDAAMDYYLRINPSAREDLSETHRGEPYVYAQMIAGRDAATPGEAKNTWLTGTAAWNLVAISQWILGVRPEHDGLRIDPCVPAEWGDIRVTRRFRGTTYRIAVRKPAGVSGRVTRLLVDGRSVEGNVVPLSAATTNGIEVEAFVEAPVEDVVEATP